jgi:hypothetical protein
MYKKSFVSLSFSTKRLQAIQLNVSKTAVSSFASADMPEGLIVNHKVADVAKLSVFIKEFLKKSNMHERSVGIILPEFSTFTKTMKLPTLATEELDEAIRWQAQEFLPLPIDKIVLDWKVIERNDHNTEVLVVAIPEDVLGGFVEAVGNAGLYPLIVETPSLSLSRLGDKAATRMVIYGFLGEVILIVTRGEKIVGSVVTSSTDTSTIIQTALSMKQRFSDLELKSLSVAGPEIAQEVYTELSKLLKLNVEWLTIPFKGFAPNQIQEYLIPLSLQLKDPAEPADENSINLLPPKWVNQYEQKRWRVQVWGLLVVSTLISAGTLAVCIAVTLMLSTQVASYRAAEEAQNSISSEEEAQIKSINQATDQVAKISSSTFLPQSVLTPIAAAQPQAIHLTSYLVDFEEGRVFLKGRADTRSDIVAFKQKLEENKNFAQITIPISSLEEEENAQFEISMQYLPAVPKKSQTKKLKTTDL